MAVLDNTEPREVFRFFEEIAAIPHGSSNTRAIGDYLVSFAEKRNLPVFRDETGNVIIGKDASAGYENEPTVILQGHMDMVCAQESGCPVDMSREGLRLRHDGNTVTAEGTTLGGDDGIAIAYALAILDSDTIAHPPLEAVFTVDEEIGMLGAAALDMSRLRGRTLLNIDFEDEGILLSGCAGGATVTGVIPVHREKASGGEICHLIVDGLRGGHSGTEIHMGRANANILLGRVLQAIRETCELQLITVDGGSADNAIPPRAEAYIRGDRETFSRVADSCRAVFQNEYRVTDPEIRVTVETALFRMDIDSVAGRTITGGPSVDAGQVMTAADTSRIITALRTLPNGIQKMSQSMEGQVETSLNFGILHTDEGNVTVEYSVRSGIATEKDELIDRVIRQVELLGGRTEVSGAYPAWEFRADSPIRERMTRIFKEQYGREPRVETVHAGVECGFFAQGIPGLDAVSFGPDIADIHTPQESLDVASVARTWDFLLEILRDKNTGCES